MDLLPHDVEGLTSEIVKSRLQKCRSPRHYNDSLNLCLQDIQLKQQQQQMNASLYGDMKVIS